MDRICLNAIYTFCDGTPTTRNMVEGENILNSGHFIHCGYTFKNRELLNIFSMCLQTSALREKPHEIQGVLNFKNNRNWVISEMKCSCKAGDSQKCKHCVATLLYLNRTGINALEAISQTDLQCTWNQHKPALQLYAPKPLIEHTHFKTNTPYSKIIPTQENISKIQQILLNRNKTSALFLHSVGRHSLYINNQIKKMNSVITSDFKKSLSLILNRSHYDKYIDFTYGPLRYFCHQEYNSISCVDVMEICYKSSLSRCVWDNERKFRITGSRCYALYTYTLNNNPDWSKKCLKYFNNHYFSNKYVEHGIINEPRAKKLYSSVNLECTIFEPGLINCKDNHWLGYSADGVVFEEGKPIKLLEIKCPYNGKTNTIKNVILTCKYLTKINGMYSLKQKHAYYGQVQLGMFLLNLDWLDTTDFCLYSSYDDSMFIIQVIINK